jgi:uncharacterized caspase-like protein
VHSSSTVNAAIQVARLFASLRRVRILVINAIIVISHSGRPPVPDPILTALVIGNAAYSNVDRLVNPVNDAQDMSAKLSDLGFSVQTLTDATVNQMRDALVAFEIALRISSVGLLFFAGHAFQIDGRNYLAGTDTAVGTPLAVQLSALHLDDVLAAMKSGAVRTGLVILDACRNNPFEGVSRAVASNELAPVFAPKGTLIAFSTSPGQKAGDEEGATATTHKRF